MYYAASLKEELCGGCGVCILSCPEPDVIKLIKINEESKKISKKIKINELRCKGCGLCAEMCPEDALEVALR